MSITPNSNYNQRLNDILSLVDNYKQSADNYISHISNGKVLESSTAVISEIDKLIGQFNYKANIGSNINIVNFVKNANLLDSIELFTNTIPILIIIKQQSNNLYGKNFIPQYSMIYEIDITNFLDYFSSGQFFTYINNKKIDSIISVNNNIVTITDPSIYYYDSNLNSSKYKLEIKNSLTAEKFISYIIESHTFIGVKNLNNYKVNNFALLEYQYINNDPPNQNVLGNLNKEISLSVNNGINQQIRYYYQNLNNPLYLLIIITNTFNLISDPKKQTELKKSLNFA